MSNEKATPDPASGPAASERCVCHEVMDHFEKLFEVPPDVRQHLANSRIEFLKAIRAAIDQRIERLSQPQQRGSRIAVE
jgi:hypothetical protein